MEIIDAHLHLWDPAIFGYDWLSGDLDRRLAASEILEATAGLPERRFIFMEAGARPEHALAELDWVTSLGLPIAGMIAFAPLEDAAAIGAHLAALRERNDVVGVRRILQGEPVGFSRTDAFRDGLRAAQDADFAFDACVQGHEQTEDVIDLADAFPDLTIVFDHFGKPIVGSPAAPAAVDPQWMADMRALAQRPNVFCKVSGLPGESSDGFDAAQLRPFLDAALDAFGPDRLIYASDWAASFADVTTTGYAAWEKLVTDWATDHGIAELVLGGNAIRAYGL